MKPKGLTINNEGKSLYMADSNSALLRNNHMRRSNSDYHANSTFQPSSESIGSRPTAQYGQSI